MTQKNDKIQRFWDLSPCGTKYINLLPGSKKYFLEFDHFFEDFYPYLLPFLNTSSMHGKRVLVIGLGSGFELQRIAGVAEMTFALDISLETIRLCVKRKEHFGIRFDGIHASATNIPLQYSSMDTVISIGCLHHIPDMQLAANEIHRVLKPGGQFIGMVYNKNSWRYRVFIPYLSWLSKKYRGKTKQQLINEIYDGSGNPYGSVYAKSDMRTMFKKFNNMTFRVENFGSLGFLRKMGRFIPRKIMLATAGRIVGLDLYFKATKHE